MSDHLRDTLRALEAPDEAASEERARRAAQLAYGDREPIRTPRRVSTRTRLLLIGAGAATLGAGSVAAAERALRPTPRPQTPRVTMGSLGPGVVLAIANERVWALSGLRRRPLGRATDAGLSPRGLNAVLASGRRLTAVEIKTGKEQWHIDAPGAVSVPRWSLERSFDTRIAYRVGAALYAAGGDGRGPAGTSVPRLLSTRSDAVAPAWRPQSTDRELAFVRHGEVVVMRADDGHLVAHVRVPNTPVLGLSWRADGTKLAIATHAGVTTFDPQTGGLRTSDEDRGLVSATFAPRGDALLLQERTARGIRLKIRGRYSLLESAGVFGQPVFAPSGNRVLLSGPSLDAWTEVAFPSGTQRQLQGVSTTLHGPARIVGFAQ